MLSPDDIFFAIALFFSHLFFFAAFAISARLFATFSFAFLRLRHTLMHAAADARCRFRFRHDDAFLIFAAIFFHLVFAMMMLSPLAAATTLLALMLSLRHY